MTVEYVVLIVMVMTQLFLLGITCLVVGWLMGRLRQDFAAVRRDVLERLDRVEARVSQIERRHNIEPFSIERRTGG